MNDEITLHLADGVAEIVLNRPHKRNSLGLAHVALLNQRLDEAEAAGVGAVVLRGEGKAFCAGRDLEGVDFVTEDSHAVLADYVNPLCARLRAFPVPTLSAVHGACLGLGFGLAMATDMVFASEDARFGSPFRTIGCVLDSGGHVALAERIGRHRAAELIFTGRLLSGSEAATLGLINGVLSDVSAEARAMAVSIAAGPRQAFAESKRILVSEAGWAEKAELEAAAQARVMAGPDAREGITAFLEKRAPVFGR
jgi:2-(1,2-epoxy-1,2-dihydrophenyl)acetyl-CoA isomerase